MSHHYCILDSDNMYMHLFIPLINKYLHFLDSLMVNIAIFQRESVFILN